MNDAPIDIGIRNNFGDPKKPVVGEAIPLLGVVAFYEHAWSKKFNTAIGYSYFGMDNPDGQARGRLRLRPLRPREPPLHAGPGGDGGGGAPVGPAEELHRRLQQRRPAGSRSRSSTTSRGRSEGRSDAEDRCAPAARSPSPRSCASARAPGLRPVARRRRGGPEGGPREVQGPQGGRERRLHPRPREGRPEHLRDRRRHDRREGLHDRRRHVGGLDPVDLEGLHDGAVMEEQGPEAIVENDGRRRHGAGLQLDRRRRAVQGRPR